ncbi:MAG TPA: hypothetical protein VJL78_00290 [Candidatus Nitrosocosmicus sp.]|nr:hypothetical protein [Candidatus Nitrosocosmicus sp.]
MTSASASMFALVIRYKLENSTFSISRDSVTRGFVDVDVMQYCLVTNLVRIGRLIEVV